MRLERSYQKNFGENPFFNLITQDPYYYVWNLNKVLIYIGFS